MKDRDQSRILRKIFGETPLSAVVRKLAQSTLTEKRQKSAKKRILIELNIPELFCICMIAERFHVVAGGRIELPTRGFSVRCSTN